MAGRLRWFATGAAVGLGSSVWVQRRVKRAVARLAPDHVSRELAGAARRFGGDLRAAALEGRQAMRDHEAALRSGLDGGRPAPKRALAPVDGDRLGATGR